MMNIVIFSLFVASEATNKQHEPMKEFVVELMLIIEGK